tara:strand:- start:224 stop:562 length:339 start_codon:yes stop_codon:yes gene_type:complete
MNKKEFQETKNYILEKAQKIMDAKQPEYTNKSIDVLNNFKTTGKSLNVDPMIVWGIFFNKQIQSILTHASDPNLKQAEPIESRYADAINYLFLGFALLIEDDNKKDVISGTE